MRPVTKGAAFRPNCRLPDGARRGQWATADKWRATRRVGVQAPRRSNLAGPLGAGTEHKAQGHEALVQERLRPHRYLSQPGAPRLLTGLKSSVVSPK